MNKKSLIINLSVILVVTGFSVYFLISKNVITQETVKYLLPLSVLAVFGVCYLSLFGESLVNYLTVKPMLPDWKFRYSISERLYGKLGSDVTPFKSAHYPLRLYYYARRKYGFYESLSAVTKCQMIDSVASVLNYAVLTTVAGVLGWTVTVNGTTVGLYLIVLVGLLFHIFTFTLCILLAFVTPFQKFMINLVAGIRFGKKKPDEKKAFEESQILKYKVYKEQITILLKNFVRYLLPIFIYIVNMFITTSLVYVAYLCVSASAFTFEDYFKFYLLTICTTYITNVIPIPGGSGSSEAVFPILFKGVIAEETLGATLVVWRFGSFYLTVIVGIIFFIVSGALFNRKERLESKNPPAEKQTDNTTSD